MIRQGTLLHDVGRSVTHGIQHAQEGAKIAKRYGYSIEVQKIIERHIGAGITLEESKSLPIETKSYLPESLEEKIVAHSDNLFNGDEEVSVEFTMNKWKKKLGVNHPSIKEIQIIHKELIG